MCGVSDLSDMDQTEFYLFLLWPIASEATYYNVAAMYLWLSSFVVDARLDWRYTMRN